MYGPCAASSGVLPSTTSAWNLLHRFALPLGLRVLKGLFLHQSRKAGTRGLPRATRLGPQASRSSGNPGSVCTDGVSDSSSLLDISLGCEVVSWETRKLEELGGDQTLVNVDLKRSWIDLCVCSMIK